MTGIFTTRTLIRLMKTLVKMILKSQVVVKKMMKIHNKAKTQIIPKILKKQRSPKKSLRKAKAPRRKSENIVKGRKRKIGRKTRRRRKIKGCSRKIGLIWRRV